MCTPTPVPYVHIMYVCIHMCIHTYMPSCLLRTCVFGTLRTHARTHTQSMLACVHPYTYTVVHDERTLTALHYVPYIRTYVHTAISCVRVHEHWHISALLDILISVTLTTCSAHTPCRRPHPSTTPSHPPPDIEDKASMS